MNIAVLRVSGDSSDLERFKSVNKFKVDSEWLKGEVIRNGKVFSNSGFLVHIPDANSPSKMLDIVSELLSDYQKREINFNDYNLEAKMDIGFDVGTESQFSASYEISLSLLSLALTCGISIAITGYPVQDDGDGN